MTETELAPPEGVSPRQSLKNSVSNEQQLEKTVPYSVYANTLEKLNDVEDQKNRLQ